MTRMASSRTGRLGLKRLIAAAVVASAAPALAVLGCAPAASGGAGTAGTGGSSAGTAGTSGAAGVTGAGTAGVTGAAGTSASGSAGTTTTGAAGSTSSGSAGSTATGAAGTTGSGGTSATTNTDPATFAYLYNSSVEGWTLNNYADTGRINLADPARAASPAPTITHDATAGNPDNGSLKVTAHFTDWKQYVDAVINISPAKVLTGKVLRARIRLTSGSFGGGAQIHAGTGSSYRFAAGAWTTMTVGSWIELAIDLEAARAADAMFDPSMVVQIGVKFDTGGDGITTPFGNPIDAVFQIDSVADGVVGGALPPAVNYTFDTTAQSFAINNYDNTARRNLGGPNSPTTPTLAWDGATGSPSPGSLRLGVSFTDLSQYVDAVLNLSSVDLTGKILHAWVKLDSGGFTGGAQLHAGAGPSYVFASGTWTTFTAFDTWVELTLDLAAAQAANSAFMANDIRQIGVQFDTGDPYEGGTFVGPLDCVFHIDSIAAP